MRPYVGFDIFEQRMRDSLAGLLAAVPRTTKLAYFNTQSVCDAKLAPPALRERALACKMAQEEGCFGCPAGVEFTPGVPAACKSVIESEMQVPPHYGLTLTLTLSLTRTCTQTRTRTRTRT